MSFLWAIEWIEANWMSIDGLIVPLFWNDDCFILIIGDFVLFFGSTCVQIPHLIEHFNFFLVAVAVAVAFFLCWAPFHSQRLMAVYGKSSEPKSALFSHIYTALTYVSGVLYFMSTCINPLLYSIMSRKFRTAFKVINFKCQLYL